MIETHDAFVLLNAPKARKALMGAALAGALVLGGAAPTARAALSVTFHETGFTDVTVVDGGAGDIDPTLGEVQTNTPFGDFQTNLVVGFSNKTNPSPGPQGDLEITSLDITKNTGIAPSKTLTITLSDDSFTFPGNSGDTLSLFGALGGTLKNSAAGDTVTFQSFAAPSGATPGPETFTSPGNPSPAAPLSFNLSAPAANFTRGSDYTLSSVTTITLSNGGESTNLSGSTTTVVNNNNIPEPATGAILGLGLIPLLTRRTRRSTKV